MCHECLLRAEIVLRSPGPRDIPVKKVGSIITLIYYYPYLADKDSKIKRGGSSTGTQLWSGGAGRTPGCLVPHSVPQTSHSIHMTDNKMMASPARVMLRLSPEPRL